MEENDRQTIRDNLTDLVKHTNYKQLAERCIEQGLLFDAMIQKIERLKTTERERHQDLFVKLTKRGPDAYKTLIAICDQDFINASRILREFESLHNSPEMRLPVTLRPRRLPANSSNGIAPSGVHLNIDLTVFTDEVTPISFAEVKKSTRFHQGDMQCYPMRTQNRGVAFIVNVLDFSSSSRPRLGGDKDKMNLVALFRQMGFVVMYFENISSTQLFSLIDQLVTSHWLSNTECFVFTLMTHGNLLGGVAKVEFTDGSVANVDKILEKFSNFSCPALFKKPKVFLFPFCRGNIPEKSLNLSRGYRSDNHESDSFEIITSNESQTSIPVPHYSDMKICYATSAGFEALREPDTGSWYIESLCTIFADHAHDKHLEELLKLVGDHTANKLNDAGNIQTAGNEDRGFTKTLYFNPGL